MKVYDLCCEHAHRFEGWFSSEDDFIAQSSQHAIACPICSNDVIKRLPSSPRLNLSGASSPAADNDGARLQAQLLALTRHVLAHTKDVGDRFAEEARRMHYQEVPEHGIRGVTTAEERMALAEEGIDVMALPMPNILKETLQ